MTIAITIGAYRLPEFVELCVVQSRKVFGEETPILVSDDTSESSGAIRAVAERLGCAYQCPPARRSHTSGDIQAFINGAVWARQMETDVAVKLSQRLVPLPGMKELLVGPFEDPTVDVVIPGRPAMNSFARPSARFFNKFGVLTDVVAWRSSAISGAKMSDWYKQQVERASKEPAESLGNGKFRNPMAGQFVEVFWGSLVADRFAGRTKIVEELGSPVVGKPKPYLRKSQSAQHEYHALAQANGIGGAFPIGEWAHIEREGYLAIAPKL